MPTNLSWSHSALKDYETCARKYHEVRVLRSFKSGDTEKSIYGKQLHEQAELHIPNGRPLDSGFVFMQAALDRIKAMPGRKLYEHEMPLTQDLQP